MSMARRRKLAGGDGFWIILPWALLLTWMFCPPICVILILLLLVLVGVKIYTSLKR